MGIGSIINNLLLRQSTQQCTLLTLRQMYNIAAKDSTGVLPLLFSPHYPATAMLHMRRGASLFAPAVASAPRCTHRRMPYDLFRLREKGSAIGTGAMPTPPCDCTSLAQKRQKHTSPSFPAVLCVILAMDTQALHVLETERLLLCKLTPDDAAFILELVNTPSWLEYIGDKGMRTQEDAHAYIINGPMASYESFGFGLLSVRVKECNTPVGICGLIQRTTLQDVDIGFALLPEYTGKGYALEAARATLQYAHTVVGLQRVVAITTATNTHSIRLLEKLGLCFETMVQLSSGDKELMLFATPHSEQHMQ